MTERRKGSETAVIVVDMLNDFVKAGGALVVPSAASLIEAHKRIISAARKAGSKILYLADNHLPDDPEFNMWPPHAIVGTKGANVIDELAPRPEDRIIPKRRYSGFFGTDLDMTLREKGIRNLVLIGVLTDICVMYTAADASARGYHVTVVSDGTASSTRENHEFALNHIRSVHRSEILSADELIRML